MMMNNKEFFSNDDDNNVLNVCPICKQRQVARYASIQLPGKHFHVCAACETFFGDANGKPGGRFTSQDQ